MNLSELILERKIFDIKIGESINESQYLEIITEEDGDIPGTLDYYIHDFFFEIIVANEVVVGIQFDFSYESEKSNFFSVGEMEIVLNEKTNLEEFINYLKKTDIKFETIESKFES
ncbi:hypothetical protein [Flavobacterium pectinovorum]|uniref:Uncharacterized protein n=1 Tax=Flavobacterium pectinovorum TaxID=29533 RepID=A0A502EEH5_9FLAO|nr:hypothetical protein [Flavobacterium pectinovorum]TPG34761.1 hypothetical protein EAH81_21995 [Flavobacterium pectinovorum]